MFVHWGRFLDKVGGEDADPTVESALPPPILHLTQEVDVVVHLQQSQNRGISGSVVAVAAKRKCDG